MATIVVKNLRESDTEESVRSEFSKSGKVLDVRMRPDLALVDMEDINDAKDAMCRTDGLYGSEAGEEGWMVAISTVKPPPLKMPLQKTHKLHLLSYYSKNNLPIPPLSQDVPESYGVKDFDGPQDWADSPSCSDPYSSAQGGDFENSDGIYDALDLDEERKDRSLEEMAQEAEEYRNIFL